ncbi:hypothetical protein EII19_09210 [Comamonadaceae bacterium OH2310_COT-174]|nr:hypothetical protein EII19_09210 [Comamonadaceae bacterium OH2310_COT-174]
MSNGEEISDFWRVPSELTVQQAALLVVGVDPSGNEHACEGWQVQERPRGYEAVKQGISAALRAGKITGKNVPQPDLDFNCNQVGVLEGTTSVAQSFVDRDSLVAWLASRGIRTGFFFPPAPDAPDYLDPNNPRYAPKLAAAVRAWQAVTETAGKTPKQALEKWIREHAAEFGLSDEDGMPNKTGIEEVAKIANWKPSGGAPRTPGE